MEKTRSSVSTVPQEWPSTVHVELPHQQEQTRAPQQEGELLFHGVRELKKGSQKVVTPQHQHMPLEREEGTLETGPHTEKPHITEGIQSHEWQNRRSESQDALNDEGGYFWPSQNQSAGNAFVQGKRPQAYGPSSPLSASLPQDVHHTVVETSQPRYSSAQFPVTQHHFADGSMALTSPLASAALTHNQEQRVGAAAGYLGVNTGSGGGFAATNGVYNGTLGKRQSPYTIHAPVSDVHKKEALAPSSATPDERQLNKVAEIRRGRSRKQTLWTRFRRHPFVGPIVQIIVSVLVLFMFQLHRRSVHNEQSKGVKGGGSTMAHAHITRAAREGTTLAHADTEHVDAEDTETETTQDEDETPEAESESESESERRSSARAPANNSSTLKALKDSARAIVGSPLTRLALVSANKTFKRLRREYAAAENFEEEEPSLFSTAPGIYRQMRILRKSAKAEPDYRLAQLRMQQLDIALLLVRRMRLRKELAKLETQLQRRRAIEDEREELVKAAQEKLRHIQELSMQLSERLREQHRTFSEIPTDMLRLPEGDKWDLLRQTETYFNSAQESCHADVRLTELYQKWLEREHTLWNGDRYVQKNSRLHNLDKKIRDAREMEKFFLRRMSGHTVPEDVMREQLQFLWYTETHRPTALT